MYFVCSAKVYFFFRFLDFDVIFKNYKYKNETNFSPDYSENPFLLLPSSLPHATKEKIATKSRNMDC